MYPFHRLNGGRMGRSAGFGLLMALPLLSAGHMFAQVVQGAMTGIVTDSSGGVILENYTVSAVAPGFSTTTQQNLRVDIQARLSINLVLKAGGASETVTVSTAPPLLETQTGHWASCRSKNDQRTPLNGRNWVFIAQLTSGIVPSLGNTRRVIQGRLYRERPARYAE